jgi:spermidine synthase
MSLEFSSWLSDQTTPDEIRLLRRVGGMEAKSTQFQAMEFAKTAAYGDVLVLDDTIQSAEVDEYLYHEALVQPAMITHPDPQRVLIIGGGEGATPREVLKHPNVKTLVMVDLDRELVEFCQQKLPSWHQGAFSDPRLELLHIDGRAYLAQQETKFDVIILDITDALEEGPAIALYTKQFYTLCQQRLTEQGVMVVQGFSLSPLKWTEHATIRRTIHSVFPVVRSYSIFIPTNSIDPVNLSAAEIEQRIGDRNLADKLKVYDEVSHAGMFGLPKNLRLKLAQPGNILEDGKPLFFG